MQEGLPRGKRKKQISSKSDCTYLKKKEKKCIFHIGLTPLTCFPNSHRSTVATHSEGVAWGKRLRESSAENPKWKGVEVAVKERSCCFYFSVSAGKLRTMHLHNTATNPVLVNPSEQLGVHGALLVHPKASSL